MDTSQLWAYLFGGASVVGIWLLKKWLERFKDDVLPELVPVEIKRPQLTIRVDVYAGNAPKIVATDAEGRLMPDILQAEGQEKALKLVGYAKLTSSPVEAVREATTTLQGVEVEVPQSPVDEGLDECFPDAPVSKQTKLEDIIKGIQTEE
jgi:hypothetical protein